MDADVEAEAAADTNAPAADDAGANAENANPHDG